ncbi:hypothetical protein GDO78_000923 [Eleutherodactylus coqui]|uniref:Uncharacterized protein n=1 Tax=Eleutherodactylus coqui TaxID=57060 RepID=A0A8J6FTF6_ELECQ|nr:hypothetical protein GDO78_000923 [Eleutherodactylus coqui]
MFLAYYSNAKVACSLPKCKGNCYQNSIFLIRQQVKNLFFFLVFFPSHHCPVISVTFVSSIKVIYWNYTNYLFFSWLL